MENQEKIKVQMTIEDVIKTDVFKGKLESKLNRIKKERVGVIARSSEFGRLDEMGLTEATKLRDAYLEILHKKSQLPSSLRKAVVYLCQPVLESILRDAGATPNK